MDDENNGTAPDVPVTLDELDDEPVLTVYGRNFFGWGAEFRFFDIHMEYKNLFGRKRHVPYDQIKGVRCSGGKIYISVSGRRMPLVFAVRDDIAAVCAEIKKVAGVTGM